MIGVVADANGGICIASDRVFEGTPAALNFSPSRRSLFLKFQEGHQENLGTTGIAAITALLHKAQTVRFLQIVKPGESWELQLPLYVLMDDDIPHAIAV